MTTTTPHLLSQKISERACNAQAFRITFYMAVRHHGALHKHNIFSFFFLNSRGTHRSQPRAPPPHASRTKPGRFAHCFKVAGPVFISWPSTARSGVWPDGRPVFPFGFLGAGECLRKARRRGRFFIVQFFFFFFFFFFFPCSSPSFSCFFSFFFVA